MSDVPGWNLAKKRGLLGIYDTLLEEFWIGQFLYKQFLYMSLEIEI